jgi:hypothetical protein
MGKVTVYIWPQSKGESKFGHAAMQISERGSYVSWWPGGEGASPFSLLPGVVHPASSPLNLRQDIEWEGGKHPESYTIEHHGLNEQEMERFYRNEYGIVGDHKYRLRRKNCSTMVFKVLEAGGATNLVRAPFFQWIWTPNQVREYAISLQKAALKAQPERAKDYARRFGRKAF